MNNGHCIEYCRLDNFTHPVVSGFQKSAEKMLLTFDLLTFLLLKTFEKCYNIGS